MNVQRRVVVSLGLVVVAVVGMVFLGTHVTSCLGPLGRTLVQSLADGCTSPYVDTFAPVVAALLVVTVLIWFPSRGRDRRRAALGALIGAAVGIAIYALVRTTSMTGPTSTGEVITVTLPFDWLAAATAAVIAGGIGWLLGSWLGAVLTRRVA